MLRLETENGWWLITHVDHAHLAGDFAEHWGNNQFRSPLPRADVLFGIRAHDDGWAARDAAPLLTRQGKPSAFSLELVGRYSAFEEIDLPDYLAVRRRAVNEVSAVNPYGGLLVSLHTHNLLSARADRSTIVGEDLPALDSFLDEQLILQSQLKSIIRDNPKYSPDETTDQRFLDHFRLLQACDNLSLLTCVDYRKPANLLHPLSTHASEPVTVAVESLGPRHFSLTPYPFDRSPIELGFPAKHIRRREFTSVADYQAAFNEAATERLMVRLER